MNETDLRKEYSIHFQNQCKILKRNFESRRINFHGFENRCEVSDFILQFIEERGLKKIGFSDGVTLHECNVFDAVTQQFSSEAYEIINPFERTADGKYKVFEDQPEGERLNLPRDEYYKRMNTVVDKMRETLLSDVLICSANAITMDGEICSIDGSGNRVAGMFFGPKHVIVIVGINKLCMNLDEALSRIHNIAAPLNYIRHINKHHNRYDELPCVISGRCVNCSHPRSACMKTAIMRGEVEMNADRVHLVVVNENLGF